MSNKAFDSIEFCGDWNEKDFIEMERDKFSNLFPIPAYVYWDKEQLRYLTKHNHTACAVYQGTWEGWKARAELKKL